MSGLQVLLMVFVLAYIVFLLLREKIRADVEVARASAPTPPIDGLLIYVTHRTERLLRELHKLEYDELAAGSHDAFRDVKEAQVPSEDDGTEIERCMKLVYAINFIRSQGFGDNLIGFPPDLDRMLDRAIQKHLDEYNHPKI